ncbi:VOC family protein [Agrococcus jejuensis]|uniref:VOC family protein n=1 Tax=Agrococcus jejuensis TaxID=399736 RepID=UPI0011A53C5E|nr:VOC family protein [Agrococcus jejuensis]
MSIAITPHLNFRGTARAALEHYRDAFGGDLSIVTHAQSYGTTDPAEADLVGWGQVEAPSGFRIMAYDVPAERDHHPGVAPSFVSARGTDAEELVAAWAVLAEGGTIVSPLEPSQWSPLSGMLQDRFGITWVLDVAVAWS